MEYAPKDAGNHDIHVNLKGAPIMNAPFHVNVRHGADSGFTVIDSYSFIVQAKTKSGENKTEGGRKTIKSPSLIINHKKKKK